MVKRIIKNQLQSMRESAALVSVIHLDNESLLLVNSNEHTSMELHKPIGNHITIKCNPEYTGVVIDEKIRVNSNMFMEIVDLLDNFSVKDFYIVK